MPKLRALPLDDVSAVKAYLRLPMFGPRSSLGDNADVSDVYVGSLRVISTSEVSKRVIAPATR